MMTRKDYVRIAAVFASTKPAPREGDTARALYVWRLTVARMATVLSDDNPRFDADRFHDACGDAGPFVNAED